VVNPETAPNHRGVVAAIPKHSVEPRSSLTPCSEGITSTNGRPSVSETTHCAAAYR
jgi:hypothetical protein